MLRENVKLAWRNLTKNRISSFINIAGLTVGTAVAILTGLWLHDELSFNTWHANYNRIAKVVIKADDPHWGKFMGSVLSYPLIYEVKNKYAGEFERVVRATWVTNEILGAGEKKMSCTGQYMDPGAPDMFTLKMMRGSRSGLAGMHSILLAQSVATGLFGSSDPIGQTVVIGKNIDVTVTGVYEDLPMNTDLHPIRYIAPFDLWVSNNDWVNTTTAQWYNHYLRCFVEIKPGANFSGIDRKIRDIETDGLQHFSDENSKGEMAARPQIALYPMSKWHLEAADVHANKSDISPWRMVKLVGMIGAFVLLLACINFMNLSTARSERRAREVGIRKAIGSLRRQLVTQFFAESLVLVGIAFVLALLVTGASLGWFNGLAAKDMRIPWSSPVFWVVGFGFVVVTGLIAGSYPALYLSSFRPVTALKGTSRMGKGSVTPRKVLVVLQFTISIALINCTIIILQQVGFAKDRPVGYSRDGLLMVNMRSAEYYGKLDLIRNELLKTGVVGDVSESMGRVTELASNNGGFDWIGRDKNKDQNYGTLAVSPDYGKTVGWQFVMGRDFNRNSVLDSTGMVINESAMKEMGLRNPIGTVVTWTWWMDRSQVIKYRIIGVVKDMVVGSPYDPTGPIVYYQKGFNGGVDWMEIKVKPGVAMSRALPEIAGVMKRLVPSAPFDYEFADEDYARKFAAEVRMSTLAGFFAALAVFISCLGLFGLASFTTEQRTKEVGIRKVLGATVVGVWRLLSTEFAMLVGISLLIAIPVAWYVMDRWLMSYSYRITISGWVFVASGVGALVVSLATVSWQAVRAAVANPVVALRSE